MNQSLNIVCYNAYVHPFKSVTVVKNFNESDMYVMYHILHIILVDLTDCSKVIKHDIYRENHLIANYIWPKCTIFSNINI